MANTYVAGIVTAYGAAKRGGYTGTYEQFCTDQANFARYAQQVREDKESVEQTVETFTKETVPEAVQSVEDKGTEQIGLVGQAGTTQVQNVNNAGTTQTDAVNLAGTTNVNAVNQAGETQVGNVQTEGSNQVQAVEDKGAEVLETIPPDYTDLVEDVADLSRQISDVEDGMLSYGKQDDLSYLALEYQGSYIGNDETEVVSSLAAHTDYIEIPDGAEQIICGNLTSNSSGTTYHLYPNVIFYGATKNKIISTTLQDNVATYNIPSAAKYVRVNQPSLTAPVKQALIKFVVPNYAGFVGHGNVTFTSTAESKGTTIYLDAGKNYVINCLTEITSGNVNFYVYNDNDVYVQFFRKGAKSFTPSKSGYLYAYNVGGAVTGKVSVSVYEADGILAKLREVPTIYEVGPTKANKSLTALLLALKDDNTDKIIYVDGGDYDIFQEYTDLGLLSGDPPSNPTTGYFDYNVWIPDNTHIIGRGLVRLLWQPTTEQISAEWSKTISPVNVAGSMTLENVEIHCKNGRYCIHDDPLGNRQYTGARKVYKNVKCYKYTNDSEYGFNAVIGFGIDARMNYIFSGCSFEHYGNSSCFYMHDRTTIPNTENAGSTITVDNCIIATTGYGVYLGNTGTGTGNHHIRMTFSDCYIGGSFNIGDEGAITQGTKPNHFDVTLLNCNDINVQIASTVNPYPVKVYSNLTDIIRHLNDLEDSISDAYDATAIYAIGDFCINENTLYRCNTAIPTGGEAWTPAHWDAVQIVDLLGSGGGVSDVQINGTSIVSDGVASIPIGTNSTPGVVNANANMGTSMFGSTLFVSDAGSADIKSGTKSYNPIAPRRQHESTFYGLAKAAGDTTQSASANAVGAYTEDAKSAIHGMLNAPVTVSGTTPTIVAKSGITYVCGEVATLDITPPASGIFEVQFVSGSTPTVLTATGVSWVNGFDPTALEANKTYEINILNGLGVAAWT